MRDLEIGVVAVAVLLFAGCANYTGDKSYSYSYDYSSYVFTDNGVDYGSGTVLQCSDSECSVMRDDNGRVVTRDNSDNNDTMGDAVVGEYNEDYTQTECEAAGFFYCTVQDTCLNQRVDDTSSSCSGS